MASKYYPALSMFEVPASEQAAIGGSFINPEIIGGDDVQLRFTPSGLSVRGRYWREGPYLKAVVHIQAAAGEPQTISAQIDLRRIATAVKAWHDDRGVHVGGFPGSFIRKVKKIAKSKLFKSITGAIKSVAKSKILGAAVGAAAVVFPPVGVPAAAAYATANAALAALERAKDIKSHASDILARGSEAEKALLGARAGDVRKVMERAVMVRKKLRDIAERAKRGEVAAMKTARIFSHVLKHRSRVQQYDRKLRGKQATSGLLVTNQGRIVPGNWLRLAANQMERQLPQRLR